MKRIGILFLVIMGLALTASGQRLWQLRGDRAFETNNYTKALEYYTKGTLSTSDDLRAIAFIKQGHCYAQMHQSTRAVDCFSKVYYKRSLFALLDYIEYGKALMELGRYKEALKVLDDAPHYPPGDLNYWIETCKRCLKKTEVDSSIIIKRTNLNIVQHSHGISLSPHGVLYSKQVAKNNWQVYQPVFAQSPDYINFVRDSVWNIGFVLPLNFNSPCLNANQNIMYYSGNLSKHEKYSERNRTMRSIGKDGGNHLYIWQVDLGMKKRIPIELGFNSPDYSCTHPFISKDDKQLFFASDMPGGYGGFDLYYVEKRGAGWSEPINLGAEINTKFDELFPSVSDGVLYFASEGHYGYGGLDIFKAELKGKTKVFNLGYPINSSYDDFSYIIKSEDRGYLISNRLQDDFKDRLWFFRKNVPEVELESLVEPLDVFDALDIVVMGADSMEVESILGTVYYNFDSFNLRSEYTNVIDTIINYLSEHPKQLIEIRAYTDSWGTEDYNMHLSEKRARSVYDFFVSHGIPANRIISKAFGETQLDKNKLDSSYTRAEHKKNRKVELKILSTGDD